MTSMRIGYKNHADSASLTASSTATGSNVASLQNDNRDDIYAAAASGAVSIQGNWGGTAYTISELALWYTNLAYNDTVLLQLWANVNYTSSLGSIACGGYTSGLYDDWGFANINKYFTAVPSVKSFTITPNCAAAAFQASRLYLGPYTEAAIDNPGEGSSIGIGSNDETKRARGASLASIRREYWRIMNMDMLAITEAERAIWFEIGRYLRTSRAAVWCISPGTGDTIERDGTVYGKLERDIVQKLAQNKFDHSFAVLEI